MLSSQKENIARAVPVTRDEKHQIAPVIGVLILVVSTGVHSGWTTPAVPKLQRHELVPNITEDQIGFVVMTYPMAQILSDPACDILLDRVGRKSFLLGLGGIQVVAWLIVANSHNYLVLLSGRLLAGFTEGATYVALPIYICEITPAHIRGRSGVSYSSAFILGALLVNCYGSYLPLRLTSYISVFVPLTFLVVFVWMPESPYFLLMKGKTEEASLVLKRLRNKLDIHVELERISTIVQEQFTEPSRLKNVFVIKSNRRAFVVLYGLRTLQQFSGGWAIIYYNQVIFQTSEGDFSTTASSIIFDFTMFLVSLLCLLLINRYGRRSLLLISTTGTLLCLALLTIYFTLQRYKFAHVLHENWRWFPLTIMLLYVCARGAGIVGIPVLMAGELFPVNIKVKAVGLVNICNAVTTSITSELFLRLADEYGLHVPFGCFVFLTFLGIFFIYYCVPETKGKTLEEIQERLRRDSHYGEE